MRVLLRRRESGFYFAGWEWWVRDPNAALDLESIEHAAQTARQARFGAMEIVAWPGDPDCELVLPLACTETGPPESLTPGAL